MTIKCMIVTVNCMTVTVKYVIVMVKDMVVTVKSMVNVGGDVCDAGIGRRAMQCLRTCTPRASEQPLVTTPTSGS